MASYYKYYDALIEKINWFGWKAELKWWDWRDNIKDFFDKGKRYHFDCKISDRNTVCIHYSTSKNEYNLVSFTLFKESWKFKCNSAFWFPLEYSEDRKNDVTYDICRDCLDDLERLEETIKN